MNNIFDILYGLEGYNKIIDAIINKKSPINVTGITGAQKAHLISSIYKHTNKNIIIVTYSDLEAKNIYEDMKFFVGEDVKLFPAKDFIFYDIDAYSTDILQQRLEVFNALSEGNEKKIIIASLKAVLQVSIPPEVYIKHTKSFNVGKSYNLDKIIRDFVIMGYKRVDMVEGKGQFSVRGGIVDIYPLTADEGYRMEFFDDEIDSIRTFDTDTQISTGKLSSISLPVAREIIFDMSAAEELAVELEKIAMKLKNNEPAASHILKDIDKIRSSHYFASIDKYLPFIYKQKATIFEFLCDDALVLVDEPLKVQKYAETIETEYNDMIGSALEKGLIIKQSCELMISFEEALNRLNDKILIGLNMFLHSNLGYKPKVIVNIVSKIIHSYMGNIDHICEDLKVWLKKEYNVVILSGGRVKADKFNELLKDNDIFAQYSSNIRDDLPEKGITITKGGLTNGFEYPEIGLAIISDKDIFGEVKKTRRAHRVKNKDRIKSFTDISVGDYVVHQNHGIGQYIGIEKLVVEGITKDYLKIKYFGGDYLYVPTNQLDLIQKYVGAQARAPKLNKLGGSDWSRIRARVKHSVREFARGLIELYAAREKLKGYAFSPDTSWQHQFEEAFPYEETADQIRSIEEMKKDMEKMRPMDRLLCGDVGYGKTEVAIRGAFKAIMSGKQVAYLVPTTVLAQQHYSNFAERMKGYPIVVEMLSRFRSTKQQKEIIKKLKTGEIDLVVGTHRLLSRDIVFKDLGLLIIDEEQRFGVAHKERLKTLKRC